MKSSENIPLTTTIKYCKRGIVKGIKLYNKKKNTYPIVYEYPTGMKDNIKPKYMREGQPMKLSAMERQYWMAQNIIPDQIRKLI